MSGPGATLLDTIVRLRAPVEHGERSYLPPFFVDIRVRRPGRAKGFIGRASRKSSGVRDTGWTVWATRSRVATGIQIREA